MITVRPEHVMTRKLKDEDGKEYYDDIFVVVDRNVKNINVDDNMEKRFIREVKKIASSSEIWSEENTFTYKGKTYQIYFVCDMASEDWRDPRQYLFQVRTA